MKKIAALFDFDGTLARGDSAAPFALFVLRHRPGGILHLPWLSLLLAGYAAGRVSKKHMKTAMLSLLANSDRERIERLAEDFWKRVLQPRLFAQGLQRVAWHRQQGHLLVLATASVDVYMEVARRELDFDVLVATRTDGATPPAVTGDNCYGEEKVSRLRQEQFFPEVDWSASFAYSDHVSDAPLLELCGHQLAVNPHRPLKHLAGSKGWPVAYWR
ncbi:MAG: hypothetical protein DRI34_01480 [Deltaproteobacteria bacterium]|nr:MAG: hypothetical protein DRI34_01480 [Deltaproteobacteria bacterium]